MDVPVELCRILITEFGDQQVIFLKERDGERSFPILIGSMEALAIDRRLKGQTSPRPMTHDLLANVIERMGGQLEKIVINDLRDHTFIATIHVRQGDKLLEIDSRPSDAIAVGVAMDTPIFVSKDVINEVVRGPATREERVELLRLRMKVLSAKMSEISERLADEGFLAKASEDVIEEQRRNLGEMQSEYDAIDNVLKKLG